MTTDFALLLTCILVLDNSLLQPFKYYCEFKYFCLVRFPVLAYLLSYGSNYECPVVLKVSAAVGKTRCQSTITRCRYVSRQCHWVTSDLTDARMSLPRHRLHVWRHQSVSSLTDSNCRRLTPVYFRLQVSDTWPIKYAHVKFAIGITIATMNDRCIQNDRQPCNVSWSAEVIKRE